jgi:hypothetical protein
MKKNLFAAFFAFLVWSGASTAGFAQCAIQVEAVTRQSADDLNIRVQGTCSQSCQQITVHWTSPLLPDKTVTANPNNDEPTAPKTWSVQYSSADGLTFSMLRDNFGCGSTNFSLQAACTNVPNCQTNIVAGGSSLRCKDAGALCTIADVDLHCSADGRLTADTTVRSPGGENVSVTLAVTRDGQSVATRSLTDNDEFITVSQDFDFAPGTYIVTASVTAPPACVQSQPANFTFAQNDCAGSPPSSPTPTAIAPPAPTPTPTVGSIIITPSPSPTPVAPRSPCPTCTICGGDWGCCIAWALVLIGLLALIATIMYLICDPSGGGGWGWLILLIALLVFALSLWWIVVNCQFNLCVLLEMIGGAFTIDLMMVCAVEGLFPCFSSLVCGITIIAGIEIRNWFLIALAGALFILGVQVTCMFLS